MGPGATQPSEAEEACFLVSRPVRDLVAGVADKATSGVRRLGAPEP
jgi:hypothetical protein